MNLCLKFRYEINLAALCKPNALQIQGIVSLSAFQTIFGYRLITPLEHYRYSQQRRDTLVLFICIQKLAAFLDRVNDKDNDQA